MIRKALPVLVGLGFLFSVSSARADETSVENGDEFAGAGASAESAEPPATHSTANRTRAELAPLALIPLGHLGDSTGVGAGGFVGFERTFSGSISLTARVGGIVGLDTTTSAGGIKVTSHLNDFTALAGARFYFGREPDGFYVAGEAGPMLVQGSTTVDGGTAGAAVSAKVSGSSTYLGTTLGAGYRNGAWDLRAGLLTMDIGHPDQSTGMYLSAAYVTEGL